MKIAIVVAIDENNVIGRDNQLIWHLPADLRHFKEITMGHHMVMGRKTFDSIGKALPGRVSVVVTRQRDFTAENCIVVNSVEEAIKKIPDGQEAMVIGGAQIFEQTLPIADTIHLTKIHHAFEGDTFFPEIDPARWKVTWEEHHEPDEKNRYSYTFMTLEKN